MTPPPIIGEVADILSETELAINIGSNHGAKEEMKFRIVGNYQIRDPANNQVIEQVNFTKATVAISYLGTRASVAKTIPTIGMKLEMPTRITKLPLAQDNYDATTGIVNEGWSRNIRIGDPAVQVTGEDSE